MKTYILTEDTPWGKKGEEFEAWGKGEFEDLQVIPKQLGRYLINDTDAFILLKLGVLKEKEEGTVRCDCHCQHTKHGQCTPNCLVGVCRCPASHKSDPTTEDEDWEGEFFIKWNKGEFNSNLFRSNIDSIKVMEHFRTKKADWQSDVKFAIKHDEIERAKQAGREEAVNYLIAKGYHEPDTCLVTNEDLEAARKGGDTV